MRLLLAAALALPVAVPSPSPPGATRTEALAHFAAGRDALQARRWPEAEVAFRRATSLEPGLALAHYGLGQALMGQARYLEAAAAYAACRDAFRLAWAQGSTRARLTEIRDLRDTLQALAGRHALTADRFMEMQLEKRLAELEKRTASDHPWTPPGVTLALGSAYFQAGAMADAEREFLAVARDDPDSGDAQNDLAVVYMVTGRLEEAEQAVRRAEKAGVRVSPRLKDEIRRRRASPP